MNPLDILHEANKKLFLFEENHFDRKPRLSIVQPQRYSIPGYTMRIDESDFQRMILQVAKDHPEWIERLKK